MLGTGSTSEPYSLNSSNLLSGIFFNAAICGCLANWSGFVTVGDYRWGQYRNIKVGHTAATIVERL